jgi:hypothetical protein
MDFHPFDSGIKKYFYQFRNNDKKQSNFIAIHSENDTMMMGR